MKIGERFVKLGTLWLPLRTRYANPRQGLYFTNDPPVPAHEMAWPTVVVLSAAHTVA